jgi:putative transposase
MIKAVKIRLYPNKTQSSYINRLCGSYRKIYNMCLEKKITAYTTDKTTVTFGDLGKYFHQDLTKNEEFNYLNEHNTKVLKQSIIDLMDAYKRFFVNNTGFPKYKSKHDSKQSARFPLEAISKLNSYSDNKITLGKNLQKVGFECSVRDKNYLTNHKDKIKSATISRTKSDKYFLSILIENVILPIQKPLNDIVGLDIGIKDFMVCSDGQVFDNLKLKRNNEKTLIKVDTYFPSSKLCSNCKSKNDIGSLEWYHCSTCGYSHNRDENAAKNLNKISEYFKNTKQQITTEKEFLLM